MEIGTPTVTNLTLTNANTEYSLALPVNCRGLTFQARTAADCRFAFVTGKVAAPTAPYLTLKSGQVYNAPESLMPVASQTLYAASATAGTVLEIITWS